MIKKILALSFAVMALCGVGIALASPPVNNVTMYVDTLTNLPANVPQGQAWATVTDHGYGLYYFNGYQWTATSSGGGGGSGALSSLTAAITGNTINNTGAQQWNWNANGTTTALSFTSSSSTGTTLNVQLSGTGNTGYAGYFSNTATTGYGLYVNGRFSAPTYSNVLGAVTTYTFLPSDMGSIVTTNNSVSITTTLPQAGTAGYGYGTNFGYINNGSGTATVNCPVALCNGNTTISLTQGQGALFYSDQNGNWDVFMAGGTFSGGGGGGGALTGTSLTMTNAAVLKAFPVSGSNYIESATTGATGNGAPLVFADYNDSHTWMTLTATGSLGIGTTTPSNYLEVSSGATTNGIQVNDSVGAGICFNATGSGGDKICFYSSTTAGGLPHAWDAFDVTQGKATLGATTSALQVTSGSSYLWATSSSFVGGVSNTGLSSPSAGVVDCDTATAGNAGCTFQAAKITLTSTLKTGGFTVSTLPAGTVGMRSYVTDQTTACPLAGAALTGSGAVTCPVFYNGSAWVGD